MRQTLFFIIAIFCVIATTTKAVLKLPKQVAPLQCNVDFLSQNFMDTTADALKEKLDSISNAAACTILRIDLRQNLLTDIDVQNIAQVLLTNLDRFTELIDINIDFSENQIKAERGINELCKAITDKLQANNVTISLDFSYNLLTYDIFSIFVTTLAKSSNIDKISRLHIRESYSKLDDNAAKQITDSLNENTDILKYIAVNLELQGNTFSSPKSGDIWDAMVTKVTKDEATRYNGINLSSPSTKMSAAFATQLSTKPNMDNKHCLTAYLMIDHTTVNVQAKFEDIMKTIQDFDKRSCLKIIVTY